MSKRAECPECNGEGGETVTIGADPNLAREVWEPCSRCGGSGRLCPVGSLIEGWLAAPPSDLDVAAVELAAALLAAPAEDRNGPSAIEHREVERAECEALPSELFERAVEIVDSRPGLAKAPAPVAKAVAS